VGLVISQDNLSSSDLPALITHAVEDSTLRANVGHLSESIRKNDGLAMAAALIEKALGLRAADPLVAVWRRADMEKRTR